MAASLWQCKRQPGMQHPPDRTQAPPAHYHRHRLPPPPDAHEQRCVRARARPLPVALLVLPPTPNPPSANRSPCCWALSSKGWSLPGHQGTASTAHRWHAPAATTSTQSKVPEFCRLHRDVRDRQKMQKEPINGGMVQDGPPPQAGDVMVHLSLDPCQRAPRGSAARSRPWSALVYSHPCSPSCAVALAATRIGSSCQYIQP
jgi:hypothetical protein